MAMELQTKTSLTQFDQRCDVCVEENQLCQCDHSIKNSGGSVKESQSGDIHKANSNFFQAVLNMVGMLIGTKN